MQNMTWDELKKIWPYSLAMIPFIALFAYELATVLPQRPTTPDLVHGYTIAMSASHKTVYVSAGDLFLVLGPWVCAAVIALAGFWRIGLFQRLLRR